MSKQLLSTMAIGDEKRLEMGCRSYYLIKREVLERYKIPANKIDSVFKAY